MRLTGLELINFRNYGSASLVFSPVKNIFIGKNGQGKTNLLEAIYFLSHSRSNRTASDRELLKAGAAEAAVNAWVEPHRFEGLTRLSAQLRIDGADRLKTTFRRDGNLLRNRSQVLGILPTVSFFLSDLAMLRGTPEDRRRWLDAAIVQFDKRHLQLVSDFNRVRIQKNRLLKQPPELIDPENLTTWNAQFAGTGAALVASRVRYLSILQDPAAVKYLELSGGQEALGMAYHFNNETPLSPDINQETIETDLLQLLAIKRQDELRRGTSLVGPHRDDIRFYLNQMDATAYGSQGQQRTSVLAVKLVELDLLTGQIGEPPVLLLDDVMAELDPHRQQYLLSHIDPQSQVFLTTTHLDASLSPLLADRFLADKSGVRVYHVECGSVMEETGVL